MGHRSSGVRPPLRVTNFLGKAHRRGRLCHTSKGSPSDRGLTTPLKPNEGLNGAPEPSTQDDNLLVIVQAHRRGHLHPTTRKSGACWGPRGCATRVTAAPVL